MGNSPTRRIWVAALLAGTFACAGTTDNPNEANPQENNDNRPVEEVSETAADTEYRCDDNARYLGEWQGKMLGTLVAFGPTSEGSAVLSFRVRCPSAEEAASMGLSADILLVEGSFAGEGTETVSGEDAGGEPTTETYVYSYSAAVEGTISTVSTLIDLKWSEGEASGEVPGLSGDSFLFEGQSLGALDLVSGIITGTWSSVSTFQQGSQAIPIEGSGVWNAGRSGVTLPELELPGDAFDDLPTTPCEDGEFERLGLYAGELQGVLVYQDGAETLTGDVDFTILCQVYESGEYKVTGNMAAAGSIQGYPYQAVGDLVGSYDPVEDAVNLDIRQGVIDGGLLRIVFDGEATGDYVEANASFEGTWSGSASGNGMSGDWSATKQ